MQLCDKYLKFISRLRVKFLIIFFLKKSLKLGPRSPQQLFKEGINEICLFLLLKVWFKFINKTNKSFQIRLKRVRNLSLLLHKKNFYLKQGLVLKYLLIY